MELPDVAAQVERICGLYPSATPKYMSALTRELWAKYGTMKSEKFIELVNEALSLSDWPPNLASFASADAAIKKRRRDLPRDAVGFLIDGSDRAPRDEGGP